MAKFEADHMPVSISCSNCSHTTQILFGRLKVERQLFCPECGQVTQIDTSEIEKGLDALERSISKFA